MGPGVALYRHVLGSVATRGRVLGLVAFGCLGVVQAALVRDQAAPSQAVGLVDVYALALYAPIVALLFATAALGDLVDDATLVYLWLRPLPRWVLAVAALAATLTLAVPLAVVPALAIAAVLRVEASTMAAVLAAAVLATVAYGAVFLALGLRVRRALAWGMAYVLVWEGAVSQVASGAARLSVQAHARSVLYRLADLDPPRLSASLGVSAVVPLVVAAAALVVTARWLRRIEVA